MKNTRNVLIILSMFAVTVSHCMEDNSIASCNKSVEQKLVEYKNNFPHKKNLLMQYYFLNPLKNLNHQWKDVDITVMPQMWEKLYHHNTWKNNKGVMPKNKLNGGVTKKRRKLPKNKLEKNKQLGCCIEVPVKRLRKDIYSNQNK